MRPDIGRIALGARVLFDSDERIDMPVAERRLGYVFQNLALFPHLTVAQKRSIRDREVSQPTSGARR